MTTKIHPLDFGALSKGSWIETEELEQATSTKCTDAGFPLRVLGLKDAIESRAGILSRVEGQRLRLMTDSEAMVWSIQQSGEAVRKLERNAARLSGSIDESRLSDKELAVLEHAQRVTSAMALSVRDEVKKNEKLFSLAKALPEPAEDEE